MYNQYHLNPDFKSLTVVVSDGATTVRRKVDADFYWRYLASIVLDETVDITISDFMCRTNYEVGRFKVAWSVEDIKGNTRNAEIDCDFTKAIQHKFVPIDLEDELEEFNDGFRDCYYDQIADEIEKCTENLERD